MSERMITVEAARQDFLEKIAVWRQVFDKIPRRAARIASPEKRFLVERILRVEIEKFFAGWTWARFMAIKVDEERADEHDRESD